MMIIFLRHSVVRLSELIVLVSLYILLCILRMFHKVYGNMYYENCVEFKKFVLKVFKFFHILFEVPVVCLNVRYYHHLIIGVLVK